MMVKHLAANLFLVLCLSACSGGSSAGESSVSVTGHETSDDTEDPSDDESSTSTTTPSPGETNDDADTNADSDTLSTTTSTTGTDDGQDVPCWMKVDRRSGATRIDTAVEISQHIFPNQANAAVLITSTTSSDSIVAGPLARRLGGPVLLTASASLSAATKTELQRLSPTNVYIVGGTAAVSTTVENELSNMGFQVLRSAGVNRYATAASVAGLVGSPSKRAFVVSGVDGHLADGLIAASTAAGLSVPVLLVNSSGIPSETQGAISNLAITQTHVVGGTAPIPDSVMNQLPNPTRLAGPSRFETAAAVASAAANLGLDTSHAYLANAQLDDAAPVGASGAPLVLAVADELHGASATFLSQHSTSATLVGGTNVLNVDVENQVCEALP